MTYVAVLRARRVVLWLFGVIFAMLAIAIGLALRGGGVEVRVEGEPTAPLSGIFLGSAFAGFIVAPFLAGGLSGDIVHYPISWTKPSSRTALAWRNVLVDVVALAVTYGGVVALAIAMSEAVAVALYGRPISFADRNVAVELALAFGTGVMWYGLVFAAAMFFPGRGGAVAGASWAVFAVILSFAVTHLPRPVHVLFGALSYLDPLAYVGGVAISTGRTASHALVFGGAELPCAIASWAIGAAAIALGVWLYARREV